MRDQVVALMSFFKSIFEYDDLHLFSLSICTQTDKENLDHMRI